MLEPRSPRAFARAPEGGFVAGERWFYFAFDSNLFGYVIWGRPAPDDIHALVRLLESELRRPPHAVLVDLSGLELVAPEAFEALAAYTVKHAASLSKVVTHTSIVRPPGVNGAIVAGFFDVSTRPFPFSVWTTLKEALLALRREDHAQCIEALAGVLAGLSGEPTTLRELRGYFSAHLASATLADAARELGQAARTLQRRLANENTSFESELQRARMAAAEGHLAQTDAPIINIALDLGFATPQHFSTLFRKHAGVTPTEFRRLRRG